MSLRDKRPIRHISDVWFENRIWPGWAVRTGSRRVRFEPDSIGESTTPPVLYFTGEKAKGNSSPRQTMQTTRKIMFINLKLSIVTIICLSKTTNKYKNVTFNFEMNKWLLIHSRSLIIFCKTKNTTRHHVIHTIHTQYRPTIHQAPTLFYCFVWGYWIARIN